MAQFSPTIIKFLKDYTPESSVVFSEQQEISTIVARVPVLTSRFRPGEIMIFDYPEAGQFRIKGRFAGGTQRVVLCVSSKKEPKCVRRTVTTQGVIIACFRLDYTSSAVIDVVLKTLYKNRKRLRNIPQKVKKGLFAVLGSGVYRTYRLDRMEFCWNLNLVEAQKAVLLRDEQETEDAIKQRERGDQRE